MYEKYSEDMFKYIDGEYVIAIKDKNRIILARDKIGNEQMYYMKKENILYYSSNLKFFINNNYEKRLRKDIIQEFLTYSYIAAPNTILYNVYKLEPGSIIIYDKSEIKNIRYYNIVDFYKRKKRKSRTFVECKKELKKELEASIKNEIQHNRIYGSFLSGGIDSTLVTAIARKYMDKPLETFTIGFHDLKFDEAQYAKEISDYLKCNYNVKYIDRSDTEIIVETILEVYDEPFADPSQIPTIILNEFAKEKGISEIFVGDGADQLFCGSNIYNKVRKILFDKIRRQYRVKKNFIDVKKSIRYKNYYKAFKEIRTNRSIFEINNFLPNRLLNKIQKVADNYNLKLIKPFVNTRVVEESCKIPLKYKFFNNEKKYILKEIVYDFVPKKYLDRPKHGFGIPIKEWLLEEAVYSEIIRVSSKEFLNEQKMFDANKVERFILNYSNTKFEADAYILWSFYIFQRWYEKYIKK